MIDLVVAVVFGAFVTVAWLLIFGHTQDRPSRQPRPKLIDARLRVTDTGERPSLGDPAGTSPPTGSPIHQEEQS